jgi:glycosyltransferase involved in cell wall biosynthesis
VTATAGVAGLPRQLRVAIVQLGKEGGGVPRYGRLLAEAAAAEGSLEVVEIDAGERDASLADLRRAARAANAADVIAIQWKLADWGGGWRGAGRLSTFLAAARKPVVATLHDVYEGHGLRERWARPAACALRLLGWRATGIVVHSDEERRRLAGVVPGRKITVVPHFVEPRGALPDATEAKRQLGVEGRRTVTLLGFITERKGHRLLLEALPLLPPDVSLLIAGSPITGREHRRRELEEQASAMKIEERVIFTGYVGDEMLDRVLAATDVAACPFRDVSASGSLSTWISAGTRVVASDLPAIAEYDRFVPGAIRRFSPRNREALAGAIGAALDAAAANPGADPAVRSLADQLALPRMVERYADAWRSASDSRA